MSCILCLTRSENVINIFDNNGLGVNISRIISKHFWIQPNAEDASSGIICTSCWDVLETFHKFYLKVVEAHIRLTEVKELVKKDEDDPNPSLAENGIKQEADDTETKVEPEPEGNADQETDSESDVPLSELRSNVGQPDEDDSSSEDDAAKKATPEAKISSKIQTVSCKSFDDIIKKNMELSCNICKEPLANFFALKDHYQSVHNEVGYAMCCDKRFDSRHALAHHIVLHQNPDRFKCAICGKVLANKRSFSNHMKTHTKVVSQSHKCEKCSKSFSSHTRLERHVKTHERREQICEQCGIMTRSLWSHQLVHSGIPKQRVQCQVCGVNLADASTLRTHVKYLHPKTIVSHVCNICGKVSSSGYGLKRHIKYMHKIDRRHKCTMCEKAFKLPERLREHMTTHTGEVLYTCPHCPKTFNSNANMHSHRKKMHRKEWEENRRHPHMGTAPNND